MSTGSATPSSGAFPIEIDLLNHKKSGEVFWNRLLISPVFDEEGQLTYFFASQFDVTLERDRLVRLQRDRDALEQEVERRNDDLTRSENRLHFMLAAGRLGAWSLDLGARRLVASELCKLNFGRSAEEPFTYDDLVAAVVPEDRPKLEAAMQAAIDRRSDYDVEHRVTGRAARSAGCSCVAEPIIGPTARRSPWRASRWT